MPQKTDIEKTPAWQYLLATVLPTVLILGILVFYVDKLNKDIEFAEREQIGLHEIHGLFKASLTLQRIRGLRQFQFAGIRSYDKFIAEQQQQFETILNSHLKDDHIQWMTTLDPLQTTLQQSQRLYHEKASPANRQTALVLFKRYTALFDDLQRMSLTIADKSNLILDPNLEVHYLIDIAIELLPRIAEHIGQIRGLNVNLLSNTSTQSEVKTLTNYHILAMEKALQRLYKGHSITNLANIHNTGKELEIVPLSKQINKFVANIRSTLTTTNQTRATRALFNEATLLIEKINQLFINTKDKITVQVSQRLDSLIRLRHNSLLGSIIAFLLMAFFISYFYIGNRRAFQHLIQARRDTAKAETLHRTILEKMIDGVITIDEKGIIGSINQAGEQIFGYRASELMGKNISMLMPSPYREEHDNYIANYLKTGETKLIGTGRQVEGLHKNGTKFPLDLGVNEMTINGQRMFTGIVRDITEHILTNRIIQTSASRLQTVLDNVIDGIITITDTGIIQSFNPAAEKIFGYRADEVIGQNVKILMPDSYAEHHDNYLRNYKHSGKTKSIGVGREVEGRRKDNSTFPMDLAVSDMLVDGQHLYSGIVRDITERKRVEKMKNEFISTVSHELRTPLTSIRGSLGLVMSGTVGELPEQVKDMLSIAANNTERLLLLINDILDIQKIESGMMVFRFHDLALKSFLEQAIQANQAYAEQHGVEFILRIPEKSVSVYADEDRLMQVMNNLLSNAAKFSPKGETVEVSLARHEGTVRISVSDHGNGIPQEFHGKLFDKFTQSDSTDTRQKGGTGLGLSIARLIVEKHGGRINFITKQGVGTTFYFDLPRLISDVNLDDLPMALTDRHTPRILIVEDNHDIAALLQRMLAEAGFNTDIAYTARDARRMLKVPGNCYRAMTLDINLPDEDGIDMFNKIRQDEAIRDLPVIVISVNADESKKRLNGGAIGIIDWLNKPIDQERLQRVVQQAAGIRKRPRVLHVEDEQDIHILVKKMLQQDCELVWTSTLAASQAILEEEQFDIVLLDIGLPDGSGLELLETIEGRSRPPQVVIFSAQGVAHDISEKVNAVLVKSQTSSDKLLKTITNTINTR